MSGYGLSGFFERLRSHFAPAGGGTSDRDLLGRFVGGDRAAFDDLVKRHGPMVLGTCRRVLGSLEDAEDAFQATFILLARKAATVRWRESARGWLYEVAYRTACKARAKMLRRKETELAAAGQPRTPPPSQELRELVAVIDEELARMPVAYRMPLVLCCLQDQTVDEAAKQLGCTPAALKSRLQRGREQLRTRLARRGFALSIALLATALAQGVVAAVPASLAQSVAASSASGSVMALTKDVQDQMLRENVVKAGTAVVVLGLFLLGSTFVFRLGGKPAAAVTNGGTASTMDAGIGFGNGSASSEPPVDVDPNPVLGVSFNDRQRFGFVILTERDPANPAKYKKLTYREDGSYNNTCVKIDGDENLYGQPPGSWARDEQTRRVLNGITVVDGRKWVSAWDYPGRIRVTQTVLIVPNDDTRPAKLNSALIHYLVENRDHEPHRVGVRMMLDTFIGAEDGVPFVVPGQAELVTTKCDLRGARQVPDFIQALERPSLEDPGTAATMMLRFPAGFRLNHDDPPLDPVVRLLICRFPGNPDVRWDFSRQSYWDMNDRSRGEKDDSCVTVYWPEEALPPRSKRAMAVSYGLGHVSGDSRIRESKLALTFNPKPTPGSEFTVTAWIKDPAEGQQVTLNLPRGMSLIEPSSARERITRGKTALSPVSWRVKVAPDARLELCQVTATTNGVTAIVEVPVRRQATGIFLSGT